MPATLDPATAVTAPRPGPRRGVIYAVAPSRVADRSWSTAKGRASR